jgi:hypothetical protein
MNQLINSLIEQSTEYMTDTSRYSSNVKLPHLDRLKLIRLVVEECCKNLNYNDVSFIKQRFGLL